jgi:hypothetical protein
MIASAPRSAVYVHGKNPQKLFNSELLRVFAKLKSGGGLVIDLIWKFRRRRFCG